MRLLNLGCGQRFHDDWINIDFSSENERIISYNLLAGIPFGENEFDMVYHSHLLEHFSKKQGENFMKECYRVLKPGGIIRVVVPDLEQIVKEYINILKRINNNDKQADYDYNWIMLELYDQTVRNDSGGMMSEYISQPNLPNEQFLYNRLGQEARKIRKDYLDSITKEVPVIVKNRTLFSRVISAFNRDYFFEQLVKLLNRKKYEQNIHFQSIGQFRESGEIHQWMYDKHSIKKLLQSIGFEEINQKTAFKSYLNNWKSYNLDTLLDESIRKPDSLFIEAIK